MTRVATGARRLGSSLLFAACLLIPVQLLAENTTLREHIRASVEAIQAGETITLGNTTLASRILLPAFYARRNFAPAWVNEESIEQLLRAIEEIHTDGLDPADYNLDNLKDYRERLTTSPAFDPELTAVTDLLLTDSLIRIGYHLSFGKVDPEALDSNWNMVRYIDDMDELLKLGDAIEGGKIDVLIESLRPRSERYRLLRDALAKYRTYRLLGGWEPIPPGPTLQTGSTGERVLALRLRLIATGDLPTQDMFLPTFDDAVAEGVRRFQRRHGLTTDGRVGRKTLAELNVPVEVRIDQIRANLERARWVLHDLPDTYIMVDIAGFTAHFYRNNRLVWESRAQVGRPARESPVFRSMLTYLDINPTWTVPPTILDEDLLPEVRSNPGYLEEKDMIVVDYDGNPVDPAQIDWYRYSGRNFPWLVRQQPGPQNALGRIKFMFPNRHSVYLHDTPSKSLFEKPERAFSSGCIRIEKPNDLAELLLQGNQGWDRGHLIRTINSRKTKTIRLTEPVTIIMLYWTVAVDDNGEILFKRDIYNRDSAIISGLNSGFSFRSRDIIRPPSGQTAMLDRE
ncbi:MAG: L,D-transpeptidase family protein [Thiohalobacterales bacterium]|nr:L,D-transpeptidase family protein [Thiohalobacterales bacterium]